ncbi:DoxX family protein [Corynebacterium sp.]|uniref:DoxX family protein n=1 Tax=Corynebacterium sp. TaxID=1720 RepID=UPI0028A90805|nr:DoxX family protein [Corynebacterium sp.]
MNSPIVRDAALLIFRVVLGLVFIAHGVDKLFFPGMDDTIGQFSAWGVPQPQIFGWVVAVGELAAGTMLVIGLLATFAAGMLAVLCALSVYFVHFGNGFFVEEGGFEYTVVLCVALLMVVVFGSGRASLDGVLSRVES